MPEPRCQMPKNAVRRGSADRGRLECVFVSPVDEFVDESVVETFVEMNRLDIVMQPPAGDRCQCRFDKFRVVPVRCIDRPPNQETASIGSDYPFPPCIPSISGIPADSVPAATRFLLGSVSTHITQIQPDHLVVAGNSLLQRAGRTSHQRPIHHDENATSCPTPGRTTTVLCPPTYTP